MRSKQDCIVTANQCIGRSRGKKSKREKEELRGGKSSKCIKGERESEKWSIRVVGNVRMSVRDRCSNERVRGNAKREKRERKRGKKVRFIGRGGYRMKEYSKVSLVSPFFTSWQAPSGVSRVSP